MISHSAVSGHWSVSPAGEISPEFSPQSTFSLQTHLMFGVKSKEQNWISGAWRNN